MYPYIKDLTCRGVNRQLLLRQSLSGVEVITSTAIASCVDPGRVDQWLLLRRSLSGIEVITVEVIASCVDPGGVNQQSLFEVIAVRHWGDHLNSDCLMCWSWGGGQSMITVWRAIAVRHWRAITPTVIASCVDPGEVNWQLLFEVITVRHWGNHLNSDCLMCWSWGVNWWLLFEVIAVRHWSDHLNSNHLMSVDPGGGDNQWSLFEAIAVRCWGDCLMCWSWGGMGGWSMIMLRWLLFERSTELHCGCIMMHHG